MLVPPNRSIYCVPEAELCGGASFTCDGPEDCDGGICCSDGEGAVSCTYASECPSVRACHTAADCTAGGTCCDTDVGVVRACSVGGCP